MKMQVPIAVLLIVALTFGCRDEPPVDVVFEGDPPGQWYKGDLHVHSTGASNDTGGDSWPSAIAAKAQAVGLDFLVLTDHSNSTGSDPTTTVEDPTLFNMGPEFTWWDSTLQLSNADFLMMTGNELSPLTDLATPLQPTGHIGCLPSPGFDNSVVFIDRPAGAIGGGDALSQALDAGCFSIVNHPYSFAPWLRYDWTNYGYDAMEVWNGTSGFDKFDSMAYDAWRCDLLIGRDVTLVGASDNHRVNIAAPGSGGDPALGYPFTYVYAADLSWESLYSAMLDGKTGIGEGESFVTLDSYDEDGQRSESADAFWIRVRATADLLAENPIVEVHWAMDYTDHRPNPLLAPEIDDIVVSTSAFGEEGKVDFAFAPTGPGVYTAVLKTDNAEGHYMAFSRAIVID